MKETLTNKQIAFVLFQIVVGFGFTRLPKKVSEVAGTEGWVILLFSTIIFILVTNLFLYLGYVHKNQTIYEYGEKLIGKYPAIFIIFIYIIYFFLFFTMLLRAASENIKISLLPKTPSKTLCILFLIIIYYAVIKRLRVIARLSELYGLIAIIFMLIIHFLMFTEGKGVNLQPFFVLENMPTYITSIPEILLVFLGPEMLAIVPLCTKNNKKVFIYASLMMAFIGLFYIIVVESCISVVGADAIVNYKAALFVAVRRLNIQYLGFLGRLDGIFFIAWMFSFICTIILMAYVSIVLLSKLFKQVHFNYIALIVLCTSFFVSQLPKSIKEVETWLDIVNYLGIPTAFIIPVILSIITKIKQKKN